jgi:hypothetical protein
MRPSMQARTRAPSSVGSMEESRIKPAWRDSSCSTDNASTPTSWATVAGRCSHLSRISAARGSDTVRSRRPRSMSASLGGLRSRRVARVEAPCAARDRAGVRGRGRPPFLLRYSLCPLNLRHPSVERPTLSRPPDSPPAPRASGIPRRSNPSTCQRGTGERGTAPPPAVFSQ